MVAKYQIEMGFHCLGGKAKPKEVVGVRRVVSQVEVIFNYEIFKTNRR